MRLLALLAVAGAASQALAYRVAIKDTDTFHEVCSGMYGGKDAYIDVSFDDSHSSGQIALVIYEWADADHLGVETPGQNETTGYLPKTYICTTQAVRSGLCNTDQLGSFIVTGNATSIYTSPLRFVKGAAKGEETSGEKDEKPAVDPSKIDDDDFNTKRAGASTAAEDPESIKVYTEPIKYEVPKTGYYCVGVVPVTLRTDRREVHEADSRQTGSAVHAEFAGEVLFRNQFNGELSAAEYPKIAFYGALSIIYVLLAAGWAFLCVRHYQELLPMQYYISGTIVFLIIEMLALFAYYRYINKHGGGAGAFAFLIVISILNAARNSLSFFLLLIVAMGLSVVTPSLGPIMNRVRLLTAFHFVFGVMYAVGTVKVDIDSASIILVMGLIIPLAMTLTAFLMWIIISLNGTILHLQERKQHFKLQMFQRLWRILIIAVIAVGGFFILSSISLSNRLDEDYAPRNWRWRWVLLDASLVIIYLVAFSAIAWLWRPTDNNVRFAMSQELAQDEADAEDYEIDSMEPRLGHLEADPLGLESDEGRIRIHGEDGEYDTVRRDSLDSDDDGDERKGLVTKNAPSGLPSYPAAIRPAGAVGHGPGGPGGSRGQVHDDDVVFTMGDESEDEGHSPDRSRSSSAGLLKSKAD